MFFNQCNKLHARPVLHMSWCVSEISEILPPHHVQDAPKRFVRDAENVSICLEFVKSSERFVGFCEVLKDFATNHQIGWRVRRLDGEDVTDCEPDVKKLLRSPGLSDPNHSFRDVGAVYRQPGSRRAQR